MRFVVHGVGAVGGVIAASLMQAGREVIGIARGDRLAALRERGLTLRTQAGAETFALPMVASPSDIDWRPDDAVILVMKGQHTEAALQDLRAAGVTDQPVFCAQNGVENERRALRLFPNVHGITVMLPAEYVALDEAVAFGAPRCGVFDIGRYPRGSDAADQALAAALSAGSILGCVCDDVMAQKHGKLILNLGNIVEAALGRDIDAADIAGALRDEGRAVLRAAGVPFVEVGAEDPRRVHMTLGDVEGAARLGGSSTQSLMRGAGSIETDFLNGEIALIARLNGLAAPLNAAAAGLAAELARAGARPGALGRDAFARRIGLAGA